MRYTASADDLPQEPELVRAENFADIGLGIAAGGQAHRNVREAARVFQEQAAAVKIRPQADVLDTGDRDRVVNVVE